MYYDPVGGRGGKVKSLTPRDNMKSSAIKDRIKEFRRVKPSELLVNEKNWRLHSESQHTALRGALQEIGISDVLIAYESENGLKLIDGHLRLDELKNAESVPCIILDVTDEEADKLLASLDPIAMMADTDNRQLQGLLAGMNTQNEDFASLIEKMTIETQVPEVELKPVMPEKPLEMTWVLCGIPTVRFGEIAELVERIAGVKGVLCETSATQ